MKMSLSMLIIFAVALPAFAADTPPDFTLEQLNGDQVKLDEYLGKNVILVDFWAMYCKPCLRAMPHLQKIYKEFKDDGFIIFGVNVDPASNQGSVSTYVKTRRIQFPILLDKDSKVLESYNSTRSMPYSVLINHKGEIAAIHDGYKKGDEIKLREEIKELVDELKSSKGASEEG